MRTYAVGALSLPFGPSVSLRAGKLRAGGSRSSGSRTAVVTFLIVCGFSERSAKTAHTMIVKYLAAAGEKHGFEKPNNPTA